jgi:multidrug efflux pump subunit AcrA (membrane-fusion protein)
MRHTKIHQCTGWFFACFLLGIMGCAQEEPPPAKKVIRPVKFMTITSKTSSGDTKIFSGVADGITESTLSFRVTGLLQKMKAKVGDKKKKGTILATLDQRDFILDIRNLEGQLKTAEAQLEVLKKGERAENIRKLEAQILSKKSTLRTAELEYRRVQQLFVNDAASKSRLDQAKSDMDLAKANLEAQQEELIIAKTGAREEDVRAQEAQISSIQAQLDRAKSDLRYTTLRMPFDGVITVKHVTKFEQVRKKQPIYDIAAMDRIEVMISIPDSMIAGVKKGQSVQVNFLPLKGKSFSGKITKVGLSADKITLTYPVWAEIPNPKRELLPGMPVEVALKLKSRRSKFPRLPIDVILEDKVSGEKYVWAFAPSNQTATKKTVRIGALVGDLIEITDGLESGDVIITSGLDELSEGMEIRLLKASL